MNYRLTILFFFFTPLIFGQTNLVPNPSFEIYDICPNQTGQIYYASPWFQPTGGTTDYFNVCSSPSSESVDIPDNWTGYQNARTGTAYSGVTVYVDSSWNLPNYREYMEVKLVYPLQSGKKYCVNFYVSLADSSTYATNDIGIYFSLDSIFIDTFYYNLSYTPQISNSSGNMLNDNINWTLVTGEFIAEGGEQYLIIGNFMNDLITNISVVADGGLSKYSYYYIDDISVYADSTSNINEQHSDKSITKIFPNPVTNELTIDMTVPAKNIFELYNLLGAKKLSVRLDSNSKTVDLTSVDSGVYVFTIVDGKGDIIKTDKLIIIK